MGWACCKRTLFRDGTEMRWDVCSHESKMGVIDGARSIMKCGLSLSPPLFELPALPRFLPLLAALQRSLHCLLRPGGSSSG